MKALVVYLTRFLLVEIPGTQKYNFVNPDDFGFYFQM